MISSEYVTPTGSRTTSTSSRTSDSILNLLLIQKISISPLSSFLTFEQMPTLPKSPVLNAIAEILLQADQATRSQNPCKASRLQRFSSTISVNGLSSPHSNAFYSSSSESITKPHACPVTPQMVSHSDSTSLLRFSFVDPFLAREISQSTRRRFCFNISTRTFLPPHSFLTSTTSPSPLTTGVMRLKRFSMPPVPRSRTSGHLATRSRTTSCPPSGIRIGGIPYVRLN